MLLAVPVGAYIKLVFVRYVNNKAIKKTNWQGVGVLAKYKF